MADYVKELKFISRNKAAEKLSRDIGEDFVISIGTNPLRNAIDLGLKAEFAEPDKIQKTKYELGQNSFMSEIIYGQSLVALIHDNVNRIGSIILAFGVLFTFVLMLFINTSTKLPIYSKHFIIKTTQLVGVTREFIRHPFIHADIRLGILSTLIAMSSFYLSLLAIIRPYPEFGTLIGSSVLLIVPIGVLLADILISWGSIFFAT